MKLGVIFYVGVWENVPGEFPLHQVYTFKRVGEILRMFAGEGGPERTNKRFHYVSADCLLNVCQPL
jgi:methylmalonyl-CoA mutase